MSASVFYMKCLFFYRDRFRCYVRSHSKYEALNLRLTHSRGRGLHSQLVLWLQQHLISPSPQNMDA
jgi:hypothetical protein